MSTGARSVARLMAIAVTSLAACTPLRPLDAADGGRAPDASPRRADAPGPDAPVSDAPVSDAPGSDAWRPDAPGLDAAGDDVGRPILDAGCVPGLPSCVGPLLRVCEGGALVDTTCALGCVETDGPARCAEMVPSNLGLGVYSREFPDVRVPGGVDVNTDACSEAWVAETVARQADGTEVCVLQARDFVLGAGDVLRASGSRPLAIAASGTVTIDGTIDLAARLSEAGPGGADGGGFGPAGGLAPGSAGVRAGELADSGGGGGGACGAGGVGGASLGVGGAGGGVVSPSEPLRGGSGGGRGSPIDEGGSGGGGGGALQISALIAITVRGSIDVGGGGGGHGRDRITRSWGSGGGGGSGGTILLEAPSLAIAPEAALLATGGAGGGGASGDALEEAGEDGRGQAGPASGGTGGGTAGAPGGDSGGGASAAGRDGSANSSRDGNGGGGGGGVGCIVLRSVAAVPPVGPTLSPSATGLSVLPLRTR